jgi:hypothetical protein
MCQPVPETPRRSLSSFPGVACRLLHEPPMNRTGWVGGVLVSTLAVAGACSGKSISDNDAGDIGGGARPLEPGTGGTGEGAEPPLLGGTGGTSGTAGTGAIAGTIGTGGTVQPPECGTATPPRRTIPFELTTPQGGAGGQPDLGNSGASGPAHSVRGADAGRGAERYVRRALGERRHSADPRNDLLRRLGSRRDPPRRGEPYPDAGCAERGTVSIGSP